MKAMKKDGNKGEGRRRWGPQTEYLCAQQKGVQSIIFRQADRAVWGVYFYFGVRVWICYNKLVAPFSGWGCSRTAAVPVWPSFMASSLQKVEPTNVQSSKLQLKALDASCLRLLRCVFESSFVIYNSTVLCKSLVPLHHFFIVWQENGKRVQQLIETCKLTWKYSTYGKNRVWSILMSLKKMLV